MPDTAAECPRRCAVVTVIDGRSAHAVLWACRDGSLPRSDWTHQAHLAVALVVAREVGDPATALGELRGVITAYNARSGLAGDRVICHETITRYHLAAVCALGDASLDELIAHPWCSRGAPLRHWSSRSLASRRAARAWVVPDLAPLPEAVQDVADQMGRPRAAQEERTVQDDRARQERAAR